MSSTASPTSDRVGLSSESLPSRPACKAEYCKAMFDYEPELQDELQLKRGDVILVLCKVGAWGVSQGELGTVGGLPRQAVNPLGRGC